MPSILRVFPLLFAIVLSLPLSDAFAQRGPVKWTFTTEAVGNGQYDLVFTGAIEDGWCTYSQFTSEDAGPVATILTFREGPHYTLAGPAKEIGLVEEHDEVLDVTLQKFKHKAILKQRITVRDISKPVEGFLNYVACNNRSCLPGPEVDFSFTLNSEKPAAKPAAPAKSGTGAAPVPGMERRPEPLRIEPLVADGPQLQPGPTEDAPGTTNAALPVAPDDPNFKGFFDTRREEISPTTVVRSCGIASVITGTSFASIFLGGFLGGLLALFTPCVFPMVPMTVSFFVKRSRDRRAGLRQAVLYGTSIVLIYVALGSIVTAMFGPAVLNEMSTNIYFNLLFFAVFLAFALSFFGLFEITLPSAWVNKSDRMADKGGLIGIFFMAFTLALVSFSCTGPIVGTLLVEAARSNAGASLLGLLPLKPVVGMFGFGLALGLPFALFALFPHWLQALPKSGNWMDNLKISLGIVELALALKFFSTADMVSHWGLLRFETFLVLWILLALLLAAYQLGLTPLKGGASRPGTARAGVGIASLAFAAYLGWGLLQYQSLSLLSGLAPPVHYSYRYAAAPDGDHKSGVGCPHGLDCYHDFDEGVAAARRLNKPLFVDFTGYGCTSCRRMEETVWDKPGVLERLKNDFVVVSLYVDDQARLFPGDRFDYLLDVHTGEKIKTVGDKWHKFQINNFGKSAQPYYVLMDNDGKTLLNEPVAYTPDVQEYKSFLDCGFAAFQEVQARKRGRYEKG
jgi:cytochrome c biogenesis protein CcdA/thioredoxin-related protein